VGQSYYDEAYKIYFSGNDDEKAIALFTKAIENNQNIAKSYMYRGVCKTYLKDYFAAYNDLNYAVSLDSTNYLSYYYFGRNYYEQGFFQSAIKYFDKSISKNPIASEVYNFRAKAKIMLEDFESALQDEDLAIKLNPNKAEYYDNRAMAKMMLGYLKNALLDEDIAIKINPNDGEYYNNRGTLKLKLHQYDLAIIDFDMAIKNGNDNKAYTNKGIALTMTKSYTDAIKMFDIAIEKMPNAIDVNYYRGIAYKAFGKIELACLDFEKSTKMGYDKAKVELNNCR
jgi:tetratricopeptide (TPR) repeat protein